MTLTLAKLQQLKRQAGATPVTPPPAMPAAPTAPTVPEATNSPSAPPPLLGIDNLRSLLRLRAHTPAPARAPQDRSLPGEQIAPGLYFTQALLPEDILPPHFDGGFDRRTEAISTAKLLFFDTETTGLAGGTGTRAFMIGASDWHEGTLRIRQLTIANTAAERAMLEAFRGWLTPDTVLCSYNGKCYDAPLLATRYRLARMANPLAGLAHVDLLYPTRRRYRGVFENCRLATIERQVLRVVREDDLPGAQAPAAWLDYLRGGGSGLLRRVLAHNHQDVVSLAALLRHLSEATVADALAAQAAAGADAASPAAADAQAAMQEATEFTLIYASPSPGASSVIAAPPAAAAEYAAMQAPAPLPFSHASSCPRTRASGDSAAPEAASVVEGAARGTDGRGTRLEPETGAGEPATPALVAPLAPRGATIG